MSRPLNGVNGVYGLNVYDYVLKFIIVGDSSVGKSNILSRFTDKRFQSNHDITIGVEFGTKIISRQHIVYKLQIWDTAGQEVFRALTRTYYRGTVGCLLVYDITQRETFESITFWLEEVRGSCDANITIALIGNKLDNCSERKVSKEEGMKLAEKNNLIFFETSAKTSENIDASFLCLIDQISNKIESGAIDLINSRTGNVLAVNQLPKNQPAGWGCYC